METVFVYSDFQIGLRDLPAVYANSPSYREPVKTVHSPVWENDDLLDLSRQVSYDMLEWTRRGRMFDGRPIFCAAGIELKQLSVSWAVTARELASHRDTAQLVREQALHRLHKERPVGAALLDQEVKQLHGDGTIGVITFGARSLVAVPS